MYACLTTSQYTATNFVVIEVIIAKELKVMSCHVNGVIVLAVFFLCQKMRLIVSLNNRIYSNLGGKR